MFSPSDAGRTCAQAATGAVIGLGLLIMVQLITALLSPGAPREWSGERDVEADIYVGPPSHCSDRWPGLFVEYPKCSVSAALAMQRDRTKQWTVQVLPGLYDGELP